MVIEEKIFKELLKKFNFVAMATRVFDGIKFCEQFLKRTSYSTFLPSFGSKWLSGLGGDDVK